MPEQLRYLSLLGSYINGIVPYDMLNTLTCILQNSLCSVCVHALVNLHLAS